MIKNTSMDVLTDNYERPNKVRKLTFKGVIDKNPVQGNLLHFIIH